MLKFDAARLMKTVLAGTATKRFTDVIQGAFEGVDPEVLRKQLDIEEEDEEGDEAMEEGIEEPTDDTPTSLIAPVTRSCKRKATAQLETSSSKSTKNKGVCALSDATEVYLLLLTNKKDTCTPVWMTNSFLIISLALVADRQVMVVNIPLSWNKGASWRIVSLFQWFVVNCAHTSARCTSELLSPAMFANASGGLLIHGYSIWGPATWVWKKMTSMSKMVLM